MFGYYERQKQRQEIFVKLKYGKSKNWPNKK